jgi:hypothetical protein
LLEGALDAHEIAEAVADEPVEVHGQEAVRAGELAQVHEQEGALRVAHGIAAGALAGHALEVPEVPPLRSRPDADRNDRGDGRDRLRQVVPAIAELFERLAVRGEPLGPHVARLHLLLDDYGAAELAAAVATALECAAPGAGVIAHLLEQRRRARGQRPPVPVVLPDDPRVRDLDVPSHSLETYDDLSSPIPDDVPDPSDPA